MQVWEMKLKVRKYACEGKLAFYRERHGEICVERKRFSTWSEGYKKRSEKLVVLKMWIQRELAEIEHIKMMANCGPIVGNRMVLHVRDGMTHKVRPGPSIIDLIKREAEKHTTTSDEREQGVAEGLDLALEILYNPYRFLDADERAAYDAAEEAEDKIIKRRALNESGRETITPAGKPAVNLGAVREGAGTENVVTRRR